MHYTLSSFAYRRFPSRTVRVGQVLLGGQTPIRIQSMTTTDTMDTQATVEQSMALFDAGADFVRITAPGPKDAENLGAIKRELEKRGYDQPLIADIHFSPKAALIAVEHVEKVRINPGNFADTKRFQIRSYTEAQYQEELERLGEVFCPLVRRSKELKRVLRIGSNHGSLSDRIMNRYGDTPLGMVESALEFIRFAADEDFHDIVVSMKSSNPQIMVQAYRLLTARFYQEGYQYPLHLGVTEAGSGRDGRMKSALGIGALLRDGIGDTIRVSLTEDPVQEIAAAKDILKAVFHHTEAKNIEGGRRAKPRLAEKQVMRQEAIEEGAQVKPENASISKAHRGEWERVSKDMSTLEAAYKKQVSFYEYRRISTNEVYIDKKGKGKNKIILGGKNAHRIFVSIDALFDKNMPEKGAASEPNPKEQQAQIKALKERGCDALWSYGQPSEAFLNAVHTFDMPWIQDLGALRLGPHSNAHLRSHSQSPDPIPLIHASAGAVNIDIKAFQLSEPDLPVNIKRVLHYLSEQEQGLFLHFISGHSERELEACCDFIYEHQFVRRSNLALSLSLIHGKGSAGPSCSSNVVFAHRLMTAHEARLDLESKLSPFILRASYKDIREGLNAASVDLGSLLLDGIGDGIFIEFDSLFVSDKLQFQLDLLQAARLRLSKTEYISCPSCGRTLFDLEETTQRIQKRTSHLKGLKIAVMGCIVNGPGEMADADFGYVGAGPGKVHLYREKELVKANVPSNIADEELVQLIQASGAWKEPQ